MQQTYGKDAIYEWEAKYKFKPTLDDNGEISDTIGD